MEATSKVPSALNVNTARPRWRPFIETSHVPSGEANAAARVSSGAPQDRSTAPIAAPQRRYPLKDLIKANFVFMCLSIRVFSVTMDYLADRLQSTGLPLSQADQSPSSVSDAGVGVLRKSLLVG